MKAEILTIAKSVKLLAPKDFPKNKAICQSSDQPEWHSFEHQAWSSGEDIREILKSEPKLKKDIEVQRVILEIISLKNLRRGRQPFVLLLGYVAYKHLHKEIANHLNDGDINGHILDSLYNMKVYEYQKEAELLTRSEFPWVRKLANKYREKSKKV